MTTFTKSATAKLLASAFVILGLTACGGGGGGGDSGGGGGGNGAGIEITASGTAARGAVLVAASIEMTCANGARLIAVTNGNGSYTANKAAITYPCIGTATPLPA